MEKAKDYCAYAASCGVIPLAPHTIFTQYLNDAVPEQREQGLRMGHELLERCDELWVTERKLLNTDEVRRVKRPHQIITSRDHPAMMYAPDLSQWMFNKMLGLGDMEHNRRLREEREQKRPIITDTKQEIALWNIWIYYQKDIMRRLSQQKGAMGGGLDDD